MAKLKLSKQALAKEREQLKLFQRLLPSLDLKRRQIKIEHDKAKQAVADAERRAEAFEQRIGAELPMVSDDRLDIGGLLKVTGVETREQNVVGIRLPVLERVSFEESPYARLARPAWVDVAVERMKEAAELRVEVSIAQLRVGVLDKAVRRITQRVNLFERVLIPGAKANIKRIQIFLGDIERDAVVRSKLAKAKNRPLVEVEEAQR